MDSERSLGPPTMTSYGSVDFPEDGSLGETKSDREIAEHYLLGLKYGIEGTDGTMWSNYTAYMSNHHPFFSIFLASPKNPYHRLNKALTFWNSMSLMFFYSCIFPGAMSSFPVALLVTLLMMPYAILLNELATCRYFRGRNCCIAWSHRLGSLVLFMLAFLAFSFIAGGIAVLKLEHKPVARTVEIFILSVLLSQLLPFILGLLNWFVLSWSGVLCCPQIACSAGGYNCGNEELRCCPLLELCPIKFVLNMYCLGESTYAEDKSAFERKYPGRVAINIFSERNIRAYESGLLIQSSDSCPFNLHAADEQFFEQETI